MSIKQPDRVRCEDCGAEIEIPSASVVEDAGDLVWCCPTCGAELPSLAPKADAAPVLPIRRPEIDTPAHPRSY